MSRLLFRTAALSLATESGQFQQFTVSIQALRLKLGTSEFRIEGSDFDPGEIRKQVIDPYIEKLEGILPKYVLGNIASGLRSDHSRRSLLGFIRRLAIFLQGAVLSKRVQYQNAAGRNTSTYCYRVIV